MYRYQRETSKQDPKEGYLFVVKMHEDLPRRLRHHPWRNHRLKVLCCWWGCLKNMLCWFWSHFRRVSVEDLHWLLELYGFLKMETIYYIFLFILRMFTQDSLFNSNDLISMRVLGLPCERTTMEPTELAVIFTTKGLTEDRTSNLSILNRTA